MRSPLMSYPPLLYIVVRMKSIILSNDSDISEPIKTRENRAETTSLSSALTSLPSHVTEAILSLDWTRASILYLWIHSEHVLKLKFIMHPKGCTRFFFFLNKLILAGKARSYPVISTETSCGVSQQSNAQGYGEIWLGSSENNGFVIIQRAEGKQINALVIIISSLFLNLFVPNCESKQTSLYNITCVSKSQHGES